MHAFDILGDPVRRRILEILAEKNQRSSGEIVSVIRTEFGITRSAVSQHLKTLRDSGFATVTAKGARRFYALETGPLSEVDAWLSQFRVYWEPKFEALATEVERGKRRRSK
ncbi:MAG: ArsR/SmtB family transcription factor [Hyphomicrobiaceae bacterium]